MSSQIVAIEIGAEGAQLAILERSFRDERMVLVEDFPRLEGESDAALLMRLKEQRPQMGETIVSNIDGRMFSTRVLGFPFGDPRKVDAAMEYELEGLVPHDIEDLVYNHTVVTRTKDTTRVLAGMMPRADVAAQLEAWQSAELEPRALLPLGAALAELRPQHAGSEAPVEAILCMGEHVSHLTLVRGKTLLYTRAIRAGGRAVDRALAKSFDVSLADAHKARGLEGRVVTEAAQTDEHLQHVSETIKTGLKHLVSQVIASLKALPPEQLPQQVLITGTLAEIPGIRAYLRQRLGLAVADLDLKSAVVDIECGLHLAPRHAEVLALLLAYRRLGNQHPMNFRRGEFAYSGNMQAYRTEFKRIGIGVTAVLAFALISIFVRLSMLSAHEDALSQALCDAAEKTVGQRICDPIRLRAMLREETGEGGTVIPGYSSATLLDMMSRAIPKDIEVEFQQLEFRLEPGGEDRVSGKAQTVDFGSTDRISAALKKDPCVQDVEISKQRKTSDGSKVEFGLNLKIACPEGRVPGMELAMVEDTSLPAQTVDGKEDEEDEGDESTDDGDGGDDDEASAAEKRRSAIKEMSAERLRERKERIRSPARDLMRRRREEGKEKGIGRFTPKNFPLKGPMIPRRSLRTVGEKDNDEKVDDEE